MGSYTSVMNIPPTSFQFSGNVVRVQAPHNSAQAVINHFKEWMPNVTSRLKYDLEQENEERRRKAAEVLRVEKQHEQIRLNLLRDLKY